ncbi:MAG TPA: transglutaminase-like domain-containing protein [Kofleriaceae bacterium]|nr:transglutaminase-like domain-containing protein [Kofleriaceae bacterium]
MRISAGRAWIPALALAVLACEPPASRKPPPAERPPTPRAAPAAGPATPTVPAGHLVSPAALARVLGAGNREQWFGMYFQDKKVGFASMELRPASPASGGRLVMSVTGRLRTGGLGSSVEARFSEDRLYAAEPPFGLVEIRSSESSGTGVVERIYRNGRDAMVAAQTVEGVAQPERRLPASREDLYGVLDQNAIEPSGLRPGQRVVVADFDSAAERDKQTAIEVKEVRRERLSGVETDVALLTAQSAGEQSVTESRIAAGGVTLRASLGKEIELRWEEKQLAQSDVVGFDIVADAVQVDRPLGEPSALRELHLVVGVAEHFRLRDAPNQEITRRPDGKLDVALFSRPGLPVLAAERAPALESDGTADAADPAVAAKAHALTAGATSREQAVARLVDWVFQNLAKNLSSNLTTASQVLARRTGDCTEHALLFVALARAAGIPAREVSGLVYMGDDLRRFGWHAWAEVDLGGRWVQVDPSWGEHVANATHLTLGVGDDADWITTMGSLTIALADAR